MQGSHSCRVDVDFQCSSQLGPGCSKANLVSEVLKQRTGKAILCRQIWFIFLKIQLTHPLLPWQMPPWYEEISSCFLLSVIAFLIKLTGVIKKKKILWAIAEGRWDSSGQACWLTHISDFSKLPGWPFQSSSLFLLLWGLCTLCTVS